jgi:hypothetical protein
MENFFKNKKNKSANDNQWVSLPKDYLKSETSHRKEKTANDNQWTSTNKNDMSQQ